MTSGAANVRVGYLGRLLELLRPYKFRWFLATGALLVASGLNLALPQALRIVIDDAIVVGSSSNLGWIVAATVVGLAVLAVFTFARSYLMAWLGSRVVADLRTITFRHLLRQPPGFFHEHKSGELVSRLTSDIEMLQQAVGTDISVSLQSILTVVGGMVLMLATSPLLTISMVVLMPPIAFGAVLVGRRIRSRSREVQDLVAEANAGLKEALIGIETVQAFTAEEQESDRYSKRVFGAFRRALKVAMARSAFLAGVIFGAYTALLIIVWIGADMVLDKELKPGELATFLMYTLMVTGAVSQLATIWGNIQKAAGATTRVFDLLDDQPTIVDAPDAVTLESPEGHLRFDGVHFAYSGRSDVKVLDDVSLEVRCGEVVALVGYSGAGKSTIATLVHRFFDPDSGRITLDGHDLTRLRLQDLRGAIGTVHQEPMLFSGTIGDNIRYGKLDATDDEVIRAAQQAWIAEFIEELPDGYETQVGERGVKLSGGQRQRIAIARALLTNPRILILDEATSHLDTANEALVHEALSRLMTGRTTIVIAHRLSTVKNADRILVVDQGRIVERGTHDELHRDGTIYPKLTADQTVLA